MQPLGDVTRWSGGSQFPWDQRILNIGWQLELTTLQIILLHKAVADQHTSLEGSRLTRATLRCESQCIHYLLLRNE